MLQCFDGYGNAIEEGNIVKVPKYGRKGQYIGTVVKIQKHRIIVSVSKACMSIGKYSAFSRNAKLAFPHDDVMRWEIEDRI